jgi:hypothetical protein
LVGPSVENIVDYLGKSGVLTFHDVVKLDVFHKFIIHLTFLMRDAAKVAAVLLF